MTSESTEHTGMTGLWKWLRTNHRRLLKFAGVGVSGVVVNLLFFNLAFYLVLTPISGGDLRFVLANAAGFVVSVFTNFVLNDLWTWGDRRKGGIRHWFYRLTKYYITASGAGAVQLFTAWVSLTIFWSMANPTLFGQELAPQLSVLTGIGCGMIINFTASHLWAFRDAPSHTPR